MGKKSSTSVVARDFTVNFAKRLHGIAGKKRAPRALRALKKFAVTNMGTEDVRIDVELNKHLWSKGIGHVPGRVRVRLSRLRSENGESFYTVVSHVPVDRAQLRHLTTQTAEQEAQ